MNENPRWEHLWQSLSGKRRYVLWSALVPQAASLRLDRCHDFLNIFVKKMTKIAENCGHSIDPWTCQFDFWRENKQWCTCFTVGLTFVQCRPTTNPCAHCLRKTPRDRSAASCRGGQCCKMRTTLGYRWAGGNRARARTGAAPKTGMEFGSTSVTFATLF
jgi:hypothetical protein